MATLTAIVIFMLGILGAAISNLLSDEFKAWLPRVVQSLTAVAVKRLPANQRERFGEEWASHVDEVPGAVGKVLAAVGFLFAAHRMSTRQPKESALEMREDLGSITLEAVNDGTRRLTIRAKVPPHSTVWVDLKTGKIFSMPIEASEGSVRSSRMSNGTKQVIEFVMGELIRENEEKPGYFPRLKLTVNEFTPDEEKAPVKRWIIAHELTPMSGLVIEDGRYTLRYMLDGQQQVHAVRVQDGRLMAG